MNVNLVMQVGPRRPARHAHDADDLASPYFLPHDHIKTAEVGILSGETITMVDQNFIAVTRVGSSVKKNSIGSRADGCPGWGPDIDTGVESAFSSEGVHPLSETRRDDPVDRPQGWSRRVIILILERGRVSR